MRMDPVLEVAEKIKQRALGAINERSVSWNEEETNGAVAFAFRSNDSDHSNMDLSWRELIAEEDEMNSTEVEDLVESRLEPKMTPFESLRGDAGSMLRSRRSLGHGWNMCWR